MADKVNAFVSFTCLPPLINSDIDGIYPRAVNERRYLTPHITAGIDAKCSLVATFWPNTMDDQKPPRAKVTLGSTLIPTAFPFVSSIPY